MSSDFDQMRRLQLRGGAVATLATASSGDSTTLMPYPLRFRHLAVRIENSDESLANVGLVVGVVEPFPSPAAASSLELNVDFGDVTRTVRASEISNAPMTSEEHAMWRNRTVKFRTSPFMSGYDVDATLMGSLGAIQFGAADGDAVVPADVEDAAGGPIVDVADSSAVTALEDLILQLASDKAALAEQLERKSAQVSNELRAARAQGLRAQESHSASLKQMEAKLASEVEQLEKANKDRKVEEERNRRLINSMKQMKDHYEKLKQQYDRCDAALGRIAETCGLDSKSKTEEIEKAVGSLKK